MNKITLTLCIAVSFSFLGCMSKRDMAKNGSDFFTPPRWVIHGLKADNSTAFNWSESYELKEKNGEYTMVYMQLNEKDSQKVLPVTITGVPIPQTLDEQGQPIEDDVHFRYGFETTIDDWTITLTNPTDQPISVNRPNGDYWKINSGGMLEVWSDDMLVEVIPNSFSDLFTSLFMVAITQHMDELIQDMDKRAKENDGKLHLLQDRLEFECAQGHRWELDLLSIEKNTWCQECPNE